MTMMMMVMVKKAFKGKKNRKEIPKKEKNRLIKFLPQNRTLQTTGRSNGKSRRRAHSQSTTRKQTRIMDTPAM